MRTAEEVFMPLTVGGGIRTLEDIRNLLKAGADKVSINTAAVNDPDFIKKSAERFGSQCIVVAIDAKRTVKKYKDFSPFVLWADKPEMADLFIPFNLKDKITWEVYTHGGRKPTGIDAIKWAKKVEELGAGEILLTSMDRDGTKDGYDIELTRTVAEVVGIPVIASGGAGNLEHLYQAVVEGKADAVLAASIFHYREYTIREAKEYLQKKGVAVRL